MAAEKIPAVLFLERDRLYLFEQGDVYTIAFPPNAVRDLDLLDPTLLAGAIEAEVKKASLPQASLIFVLSDAVLFSRDLPEERPSEREEAAKTFLDSVPFNLIVSKVYSSGSVARVVAGNGELVNAVMEVFERLGYSFEALVPSAIFGQFSGKRVLDSEMGSFVIENRASAVMQSMIGKREPVVVSATPAVPSSKKSKLPYLAVTFVILLLVLVALLVFRR